MNNTFVILDSSALIAQINVKDIWHKQADATAAFIARTERKVLLPAEVFAEALNRIGNNIGRQEAALAGMALLPSQPPPSLASGFATAFAMSVFPQPGGP